VRVTASSASNPLALAEDGRRHRTDRKSVPSATNAASSTTKPKALASCGCVEEEVNVSCWIESLVCGGRTVCYLLR
jgi:hypothetical protein